MTELITFGTTPNKRETAEALLRKGPLLIGFSTRAPGVVVPEQVQKEPWTVFMIGRGTTVNVESKDFESNSEHMRFTYSWNRGTLKRKCTIPWAAVFMLTDPAANGAEWPEDKPSGKVVLT